MNGADEDWGPPEQVEEYRLIRMLGRGAMGKVYLAEDRLLNRLVAIKFIAATEPSEKARRRLFSEARAIARLTHPNVVAIYRVAELRGRPFLVSEYIRGRTLSDIKGPMVAEELLRVAVDLARALAAAHRCGVLHRDIKPANIIISEEGTTKLLDFGIAELTPERFPHRRSDDRNAIEIEETQLQNGTTASVLPREVARRIAGTPGYIAPEIWQGEPPTERADIYSMGVVLFELCTGTHPHADRRPHELASAVINSDAPSVRALIPTIDEGFARIVDGCLSRTPATRPRDGDALREALEALADRRHTPPLPEGNPYRGLAAFEAEHRHLFFGRRSETLNVIERLRSDQRVIVVGDSGTGKSSLCRAGVLPLILDGALGSRVRVATVSLGRDPISSVAAALGALIGEEDTALAVRMREEPVSLTRALRGGGPIILFVDQLEEIIALSEPIEAALAATAIHAMTERGGGVRLLATARSDFLTRLSALPGIGDGLPKALYVLRPLADEVLEDVVVGPATAKGFQFESPEMVRTLIRDARTADGGLPLLQFALAELWEARNEDERIIPAEALNRIGGVAGALARHADNVVASLPRQERAAAQSMFLELVTAEGTRGRRSHRELMDLASCWTPRGTETLDALVRGRLLLAQEADADGETAYVIAHEALVRGWDTLRGWLSHDAEGRALRQRVERASAEWARLGRIKDALWGDRLLHEAEHVDEAALTEQSRAFLSAARRSASWRRAQRWALLLGLPTALASATLITRIRVERSRAQAVAAERSRMTEAKQQRIRLENLRRDAFTGFDNHDADAAEDLWKAALQAEPDVLRAYVDVEERLERLLREDPDRKDAQSLLADVLLERASMAEQGGRLLERDDMVRRLGLYGAGDRWTSPSEVSIETHPHGADVRISRYQLVSGRWQEGPSEVLGETPIEAKAISPGSIVLLFSFSGRESVRLPVLLRRGEAAKIVVDLPYPTEVPDNFVLVPAGKFLYGTAGGEEARNFYGSQPMHEIATKSYLIAREETTYADWIEFLRSLPKGERANLAPDGRRQGIRIALTEVSDGDFRIALGPEDNPQTGSAGQLIHYRGRAGFPAQNWARMPVSGITFNDALAYTDWLHRTGRVRGARACTEHEWERAARGADGRAYPHGEEIKPNEANYDLTYGRAFTAFGPDEVGSHRASDSPFGVQDLAGNVWEWTAFMDDPRIPVARGGSFFQSDTITRPENRAQDLPTRRDAFYGFRVCATYPAP